MLEFSFWLFDLLFAACVSSTLLSVLRPTSTTPFLLPVCFACVDVLVLLAALPRAGSYEYFYLGQDYEPEVRIRGDPGRLPSGPMPQTGLSQVRGSALTVRGTRASTSGSSEGSATGQAPVTAVGKSISAAVWGSSRGRTIEGPDDRSDRFVLIDEPRRYAGTSAAGTAFGRSNPSQLASSAALKTATQANVNAPLPAGTAGQVVGYASGSQSSGTRGQVVGITGSEFVDFDVAG